MNLAKPHLHIITCVQSGAFHLQLHLVYIHWGNGCRLVKVARNRALKFYKSPITRIIQIICNLNAIRRCAKKTMNWMRNTGCINNLHSEHIFKHLFCDRFIPSTPHQRAGGYDLTTRVTGSQFTNNQFMTLRGCGVLYSLVNLRSS